MSGRQAIDSCPPFFTNMNRITQGIVQLHFLWRDVLRIVNCRWHRLLSVPFSCGFHAVAAYRLERCLFLLAGRWWKIARIFLTPVFFLFRPWFSACEIHYEADIGPGLLILHPSLGLVVTGKSIIGKNVTFTGGNCIGTKGVRLQPGDIQIGNHVLFGANAVVLGPIRIGDRAVISAGSVAMRNIESDAVVGGVPAKTLLRKI